MAVVMSGAVGAQAIPLLLMPVISRMYSSADYGVFGSFNSVVGVVMAGATLQYAQAVVLPKHDKDALNLCFVACSCVLAVASLCGGGLALFPAIRRHLLTIESDWLAIAFSLLIVARGLQVSLQAWCIRVKAFHHTSLSHVIGSLGSAFTWTGFGLLGAGAWGLIVGSIIGAILSLANLLRVVRRDLSQLSSDVSLNRMRSLALEYRDFPYYAAPQNLMNALSQGLPVLLFAQFYDMSVAGAYAFGNKIIATPLAIILTALRQVLFQKASEVHNTGGDIKRLFFRTTGGLLALVILPTLLFFACAPQLFAIAFGAEWQTSGEYARWLVIWQAVSFCNVPASLFARILRQQRALLLYELTALFTRTATLILTGYFTSAIAAIATFSLLGAGLNLLLIGFVAVTIAYHNNNEPPTPV